MVKNSNHWDRDVGQPRELTEEQPWVHRGNHTFSFSLLAIKPSKPTHTRQLSTGLQFHLSFQFFFYSGKDFLPGFRQFKCQQTSADQGREGQEDGDDLSDANEGREDEAGDDGSKFTDPVQDTECCSSAVPKDTEIRYTLFHKKTPQTFQ